MANFTASFDPQKCLTIQVQGNFDYSSIPEFRALYENVDQKEAPLSFVVDLSQAQSIDSSALGLLMMLRRHSGPRKMVLKSPNADITKILVISKLDGLFDIQ